jgi:uncharacterized protein (DUF779 family)
LIWPGLELEIGHIYSPILTVSQLLDDCYWSDKLKEKVSATKVAQEFLKELKLRYGADLLFHQSGGCCDGSSPMLFEKNEFVISDSDISLGTICNVPFYMNRNQYSRWEHTNLVVDLVDGMGGMFSLDNGTGKRFLIRSEVCTVKE